MIKRNGFTLAELAIVLLIVGLLVVGISSGTKLIRQSELRSIITDLEEYNVAVKAFQLAYQEAIPGDFENAVAFWGSEVSNGDGNGAIDIIEREAFWEHLAMAGLVAGSFNGSNVAVIGVNYPESKLDNVGYYTAHADNSSPILGHSNINFMNVGSHISNDQPWGGAFSPLEARGIDQKIDDGLPDSGGTLIINGNDSTLGTDCIDSNWTTATSANLVLSQDTKDCRLIVTNFLN